jgi:uncharacterized membrane protein YphA (DoxX/SURF4 family)
VGLLLLRAALGGTLIVQGFAYLADWHNLTLATWTAGLLVCASGLLLLVGYLTPLAGVMGGLTSLGSALALFPGPALNLFDTKLVTGLAAAIAAAIICVGPGAFSLDGRLFGRREIIIPNSSPRS